MRIKLVRCVICNHWYAPHRSHCELCGAFPIKILAPKLRGPDFVILRLRRVYIDWGSSRQVKPQLVSGNYNYSRFVQFRRAE